MNAKLIWFSDLHFKSEGYEFGHDPRARLEAVIDHICAHYSDAEFCVISGDMVEDPTAENYADLAARLERLPMPYLPMVGNHDLRAPFLEALPVPDACQAGFVQYVHYGEGFRAICADTLTEGKGEGSYCEARFDWLREELSRDQTTPTLVFCHHPPLALGFEMLDPSRIPNGEALIDLLAAAPNVKHLFFGHVHRPCFGSIRGLAFASIRSVLYQAPPPLPKWDWDSFKPALEAPEIGVLTLCAQGVTVRFEPFCEARTGLI